MEPYNLKSTLQVVLDKDAMDQVICFYLEKMYYCFDRMQVVALYLLKMKSY